MFKDIDKDSRKLLIIGCLGICLTILLILFMPVIVTSSTILPFETTSPNEIGDTIGGVTAPIVGVLGVGLTFLAFWAQYEANKEQRRQFTKTIERLDDEKKEQFFENQFYEMLRLHKENVNAVRTRFPNNILDVNDNSSTEYTGREALSKILDHFHYFLDSAFYTFSFDQDDYESLYKMFFWGYEDKYFNRIREKHAAVKLLPQGNAGNTIGNDDWLCTLMGHHIGYSSHLAHYFRHLYAMVKLVANSSISEDEKMRYLKVVRAQLSNQEQALLFYNWICRKYGENWEKGDNRYFTKYRMIHNIWPKHLYQAHFIIDKLNFLIDKYNEDEKSSKPLFEFQEDDVNYKYSF
ncbi:putative phage abortive infection protein [Niabella aquatica]